MRNFGAIFKKEMKSYFNSPMAYIVITVFLLICGWFFANSLFVSNLADMRQIFGIISMVYVFYIPAITMRLLSEERKTGTLELLVTLPINDGEIISGKFMAAFSLLGISLLGTVCYLISLALLGDLDSGGILGGYIGLLLMGAVYLSLGIFISSLTENQIIAYVITFLLVLFLYLFDKILFIMPLPLVPIFEYLSATYHYENFARGVIDTRDIVYFASSIFIGLYLATRSLKSRKWA